jgi:hypothetical protein
MDEKIVDQLLSELVASLEEAETQSTAIILFLKGEGITTEEKLAPYIEQAGKASDVRWRAARARLGALLHSALKLAEPSEPKTAEADAATKAEKAGADNASRSKERSQANEKPENSPSQNTARQNNNEQSKRSNGVDDAKAVTPGASPGTANPEGSQRTGNSQTSGSEASSDAKTAGTSISSSDKPRSKN